MSENHRTAAPKRVLVSGSSGLVGSALVPQLQAAGHEVRRLRRSGGGDAADPRWDPARGTMAPAAVDGFDAVVHLAGEGIAERRWSGAQKRRIRDSRVDGTRLLAETIARVKHKPEVLVCASAVGFYGSRADEWLDEDSSAGNDFLAEVCAAWESAAAPARDAGVRVVHLRFGAILSADGGALAKMLLPFRLGAGGVIGSGQQYMSWISIDDASRAVSAALADSKLAGPVNTVAPNPVTNSEFTKALGRVLRRPTVLPLPGFAARIALGEMADGLLLASQRTRPKRLEAAGFEFEHPDVEGALRHVLGRATPN